MSDVLAARVRTGRVKAGPVEVRRVGDGWVDLPYERLTIAPLATTIGAEVTGVDLAGPLDDAVVAELKRALLEWKVLFLRDQHLTSERHRDLAALWGELEVHPFLPHGDVPEVVRFEKDGKTGGYENTWHADVTWKADPPLGSVLRSIEVPSVGGDTMWCDMGAAYDGLDDDVKARIDGLVAVHDFTKTFGLLLSPEKLAEMQEQYPAVEHPVVLVHPETGRKTLYVNRPFTDFIVGEDDDSLLLELLDQTNVPEYQVRFKWTPGAVAIWDNRATQHYALSDYFPQRRVMERCTILG